MNSSGVCALELCGIYGAILKECKHWREMGHKCMLGYTRHDNCHILTYSPRFSEIF